MRSIKNIKHSVTLTVVYKDYKLDVNIDVPKHYPRTYDTPEQGGIYEHYINKITYKGIVVTNLVLFLIDNDVLYELIIEAYDNL